MEEIIMFPDFNKSTLEILWELTERCNFKCTHCGNFTDILPRASELDFDQICTAIDHMQIQRPLAITFTGGEPFLRDDFCSIIDLLYQRLDIARIHAYSNGSKLFPMGTQLLEKGVSLWISLEGTDKNTIDEIRGKGSFALVVNNLRKLINIKSENPDLKGSIGIAYTITAKSNSPDELLDFAENIGVDALSVTRVSKAGRAMQNEDLLISDSRIFEFIERLIVLKDSFPFQTCIDPRIFKPLVKKMINLKNGLNITHSYIGCGAAQCKITILADGSVVPCREIYPGARIFDSLNLVKKNIKDNLLFDILGSMKSVHMHRNRTDYRKYYPCHRCEYAGGYCDPCWKDSYFGESHSESLCAYVIQKLDMME